MIFSQKQRTIVNLIHVRIVEPVMIWAMATPVTVQLDSVEIRVLKVSM